MGQQRAMERIAMLQDQGRQRRGMGQALRDIDYQDFLEERDFPWQQMGRLGALIGGIPTNTMQSTNAANPSIFSQLLGLGVGSAAINRLMG